MAFITSCLYRHESLWSGLPILESPLPHPQALLPKPCYFPTQEPSIISYFWHLKFNFLCLSLQALLSWTCPTGQPGQNTAIRSYCFTYIPGGLPHGVGGDAGYFQGRDDWHGFCLMNAEASVPTPPISTDIPQWQSLPQTPFPLPTSGISYKRNRFYTQTNLHQQEVNPLRECYKNENDYYSQQ